jgi:hypothetical protein
MNGLRIRDTDSDRAITLKGAIMCMLLFTMIGGAFVECIPGIDLERAYRMLAMLGFYAGLHTNRAFWLTPWA